MEVFFVGIIIALVVCLLLLFIVPTLTVAGGLIALVVGLLAQTYDAIEAVVRRWNGGGRDEGHPLFANATGSSRGASRLANTPARRISMRPLPVCGPCCERASTNSST